MKNHKITILIISRCNFRANRQLHFFFFYFGSHKHLQFTKQQEKGEGIFLTSLNLFHQLHRHLDISWVITADRAISDRDIPELSQQPDSMPEPLDSKRKSLTTNLRALEYLHGYIDTGQVVVSIAATQLTFQPQPSKIYLKKFLLFFRKRSS